MISLDQIQLLEKKVETAISRIIELQAENSLLKSSNSDLVIQNEQLVQKVADLQESVSVYEHDKDRIEQGIISALNRLTDVENTVLKNSEKINKEFVQTQHHTEQQHDQPLHDRAVENTTIHADNSIFHGNTVEELSVQDEDFSDAEAKSDFNSGENYTTSLLSSESLQENEATEKKPFESNNSQFDIF
ncbi:MAG: cell division protein ZapB [Treponemataceae bacterium]